MKNDVKTYRKIPFKRLTKSLQISPKIFKNQQKSQKICHEAPKNRDIFIFYLQERFFELQKWFLSFIKDF